jgi:23S rRNA U2552 (ribose-2'-O)-methylase RlmE/FtsJ
MSVGKLSGVVLDALRPDLEVVVPVIAALGRRKRVEKIREILDEARLALVDHDRARRVRGIHESHSVRNPCALDRAAHVVRHVDELHRVLGNEVVILEEVNQREIRVSVRSRNQHTESILQSSRRLGSAAATRHTRRRRSSRLRFRCDPGSRGSG